MDSNVLVVRSGQVTSEFQFNVRVAFQSVMIERVFPQLVGALDDAEEPAVDPGEVGQVRRIQVGCDLEDHLRREVWKRLFWKKYLVTISNLL